MAFAAPAIPIISAVAGLFGIHQSVQAYRSEKKAAAANEAIATANAQKTREETAQLMAQQKRENIRRIGALRARAGGRGTGQAGNALDMIADQVVQNRLELGYIEKYGRIRASNLDTQAQMYGQQAKSIGRAGLFGAASDLLNTASTAYGQWERAGSPNYFKRK